MITIPSKVNDITGNKFGRLEVLRFFDISKHRRARWVCRCDCGNSLVVIGQHLLNGNTTSCGCYNKEKISLPNGKSSRNKVYSVYRRNARKRGLDFEISRERFDTLISLNCFYCGRSPAKRFKLQNGNGEIVYNGIDRLNNGLGYIENNVVPCCYECNLAKRQMSYEDFKSWIFDLADNMIAKELLFAKV